MAMSSGGAESCPGSGRHRRIAVAMISRISAGVVRSSALPSSADGRRHPPAANRRDRRRRAAAQRADRNHPVDPARALQYPLVDPARIIGGGDQVGAGRIARRVRAVEKPERGAARPHQHVHFLDHDDAGALLRCRLGAGDDDFLVLTGEHDRQVVTQFGRQRHQDRGFAGAGRPGQQHLAHAALAVAGEEIDMPEEMPRVLQQHRVGRMRLKPRRLRLDFPPGVSDIAVPLECTPQSAPRRV